MAIIWIDTLHLVAIVRYDVHPTYYVQRSVLSCNVGEIHCGHVSVNLEARQ